MSDPDVQVDEDCVEETEGSQIDQDDNVDSGNQEHSVVADGDTDPGDCAEEEQQEAEFQPDIIDVVDVAAEIAELRQEVIEGFAGVLATLNDRLTVSEERERIFDKLHEELQGHRRGLHFQLLKPIVSDLITLYDRLKLSAGSDADGNPVNADFVDFAETVEEILARNGVAPFVTSGEKPDRKRQRVIKTEVTNEPSLGGMIAKRLRTGFSYEDIVVRPEFVVTWKYEAESE